MVLLRLVLDGQTLIVTLASGQSECEGNVRANLKVS